MKLRGPVMKIPSIGPWLASGVTIIGPTKPTRKPITPVIQAPRHIILATVIDLLPP
jgi:hypothetical protein